MEPRNGVAPIANAKRPGRKTLQGVLGTAIGAAALFVMVPAEESGRKVEAKVTGSATAGYAVAVRHVSGPQYLKAYLDIVQVPTACDGITKGVKMGQTFTEAQCNAMLEHELVVHAEAWWRASPSSTAATYQAPAAVSVAYNIGVRGICTSTAARHFRARRWADGCKALALFNRAGGRVVRGLVLRREREVALCMKGLAT